MNHCGRPDCECYSKYCCGGKYPALEHHSEKSCWTEKPIQENSFRLAAKPIGNVWFNGIEYHPVQEKCCAHAAEPGHFCRANINDRGQDRVQARVQAETKKPPTEGAASGSTSTNTESVPQDDGDWEKEFDSRWPTWTWEFIDREMTEEQRKKMFGPDSEYWAALKSFIRNLLEQAVKEGEIAGIAKYRQAFLDSVREKAAIEERTRIEDAVWELRMDEWHQSAEAQDALCSILKIIRDEK